MVFAPAILPISAGRSIWWLVPSNRHQSQDGNFRVLKRIVLAHFLAMPLVIHNESHEILKIKLREER